MNCQCREKNVLEVLLSLNRDGSMMIFSRSSIGRSAWKESLDSHGDIIDQYILEGL
jgi:hypothetical protein